MKKFYFFSCILAAVLSFFLLDFEVLHGYESFSLDDAKCVNANLTDTLIEKYGFIIIEWDFEDTKASDPYKVSLYLSGTSENRTFVCNMDDGTIYAMRNKSFYVLTPFADKDAQGKDITSYKAKTSKLTETQYSNLIKVNNLNNPLLTLAEDGITHSSFIKDDYYNLVTDYPVPSGLVNITLDGVKPETDRDFSATLVPDSGYYLPDKLSIYCTYKDSDGNYQKRSITDTNEITLGTLLRSRIFKEKYYTETGYSYDNLTGKITIAGEQINGEIEIRAAANPFFKFVGKYYGFTNGHIRKSYIIDEQTNEIETLTIKYYEPTDKGTEKNKCKIGNAYVINDTYFIFNDEFKEGFPELFEALNSEMRLYEKSENTFDYNH